MPFKAVLRATVIALFGVSLVGTLGSAAWHAEGGARIGWSCAMALLLLVAGYLLWVYLPDVDWPGRSPSRGRRGPAGQRRIALTFDDGPNGEHTAQILDVLKRHDARATFFCVGDGARRWPELVRRMNAEGHIVGNHTLDHRKLAWCSAAEVARQIEGAQAALIEAGAPPPTWFRAPHGFKSPFLGRVLGRAGLRLVAWSHGVWDTDRPGADVIARRAARFLDDGEILLLHDGTPGADRAQTTVALDEILHECARRGLRTVTLSELLGPA